MTPLASGPLPYRLPWSHIDGDQKVWSQNKGESKAKEAVTNFIWLYLHQFFDYSHGLKTNLKPLKRPFDQYQSHLKAINNGQDIKQINW